MNRVMTTLLSFALMTSSTFAGESFYRADISPGPFLVFGSKATPEINQNPMCYAEVLWRDGSRFQVIRDLADAELYIFFQNNQWNIRDKPGEYKLRANFEKNGIVSGLNFEYQLVNKNSIVIRGIMKDKFLPAFMNNNKMHFVMPGTIQNVEVDLTGSSRAINEISKCIDAARSVDLYPEDNSSVPNGKTNI